MFRASWRSLPPEGKANRLTWPLWRWHHVPRMTPDEVLLIKGWDSLEDGRARFAPHGAFEPPDTPEEAAPRESIEVRTLVVIEG